MMCLDVENLEIHKYVIYDNLDVYFLFKKPSVGNRKKMIAEFKESDFVVIQFLSQTLK